MDDFEPERRNLFLRGAVFVANAFLVLFAAEAAFSLLNAAVLKLPPDSLILVAQTLIGVSVVLLAFVAIAILVFVPHIPKIVLLPPVLVLLWQIIGAPPLVWSPEDRATWIPIDAVGLGAALFAFIACKLTTGGWLLSASNLPHKSNLALRTFIALPVFVVVMTLTLAGVAVAGFVTLVQLQTKDYLHFAWSGVEVRETVMRKGDKVVHLVAMVHFAEPRFYQELFASMPPGSLILAEGITDNKGVLTNGLRYNNAARALGLETQDVFQKLLIEKARIKPAAEEPKTPTSASDKRTPAAPPPPQPPAPSGPDVIRADVDASDFSPTTIKFLQRVGDVYASANMNEALDKLSKIGNEFTDDDLNKVMDDILHLRNTRVLKEFDAQLPKYQVIYIPWGAQHMPDLEAGLIDRGFRIESSRLHSLARYETIFGGLTR